MRAMRVCSVAGILGLMCLTGCIPDFVSVSDDGTIALTLHGNGEFQPVEEEEQSIYLTNANADFLIKVEGLEGCGYPQISPSGRSIAAISEDGLVLYDRETKERRVVHQPTEEDDDWSAFFPVWSPDEKKLAFFVGDFGEDVPNCRLIVYDVESREREVVARRTSPRASWMPDSRRLLYVSVPPGVSEGSGEPPFGSLAMIDVRTGEKKILARRQLFFFSRTAVFPRGNAILYPFVSWHHMDLDREGVMAPVLLKKEILSLPEAEAEESRSNREEAKPAKPDVEKPQPTAAGQKEPEEKGFVLEEGQPFHPHMCEVSPDGNKIAYARQASGATGSDKIGLPGEVELKKPRPAEEEPESARGANDEDTETEGWEVFVAKADGTGSVAVVRITEGEVLQVLWVSNTRLICVTGESLLAVDADGRNKLDLIEAIRTKFPDQFEQPKEEEKDDRPKDGP
jgi:hypothetical protein